MIKEIFDFYRLFGAGGKLKRGEFNISDYLLKQKNMSDFKKYRRTQISELRPVADFDVACFKAYGKIQYEITGEISISETDLNNGSPKIGDMIGRNSKNHKDQWLIAEDYFKDNFEELH